MGDAKILTSASSIKILSKNDTLPVFETIFKENKILGSGK